MKSNKEIIKDIRLLLSLPFILIGAIFLHIAEFISGEKMAFHCDKWDDENEKL